MAIERDKLIRWTLPLVEALRLYHRHEVVGLEHIPREGRVLVVVNHSLATYDISLLIVAILTEAKRLPRPLIDRLFFRVPLAGALMSMYGAVQGSQDVARQMLNDEELVTVAPGGMREALRPSTERYQIRWDRRLGFVKLAMQTKAPVILAACPKADDLFEIYPTQITSWFYRQFRVPIFFARGIGLSPVPRPVKLVHFLSEPMMPPEWSDDEETATARAKVFHAQLVKRMHELISGAIQYRGPGQLPAAE